MPELISNVNLANVGITGNTGNIPVNLEPGIPKAVVMVPKGTIIPKANLVSPAAFLTYTTAAAQGFIADSSATTRSTQWFAFIDLDDFKDETKAMASIDTGLNQLDITKFNTKFSFRGMAANNAMYIEYLAFDNSQNLFDCFIIDSLGQWWGRKDPTGNGGLASYSLQQIRVKDAMRSTVKDINQYMLSFQFKNRVQFNEDFKIFGAGTDGDSILTIQNAILEDVSSILGTPLSTNYTAATDMVVIAKAGQDSYDLGAFYGSAITAAFFVGRNLTTPATYTTTIHAQGQIIVAGQLYNYYCLTLSATPASGAVVQITLAAPSVTNAVIPNFNTVSLVIPGGAGVNGANAAVKTFA